MKKFVVKVTLGYKNTAGVKAKEDITDILKKDGFEVLNVNLSRNKLVKLLTVHKRVKVELKNVMKNDIVLIQYPMYSHILIETMIKECRRRHAKIICLIHDVESLRAFKDNKKKSILELNIFKKFDCLITHNDSMSNWLKNQGIENKIIPLVVFDYLNDNPIVTAGLEKNLVFAGSLPKAKFLEKWDLKIQINLFGVNPSTSYPVGINYLGVKSPNELPEFLDGSFGLVWDGTSMRTNTGISGEYTKYNNPHKTSLYLSCGLPVIVWKKAAIANFVKREHVGLVVSDLHDLPQILTDMTFAEYRIIKNNTDKLSIKFRDGYYTKKAVAAAVDFVTNLT